MANDELLKRIGADTFEQPPKIVRLPAGQLMAFVHDAGNGQRNVCACFSEDNAASWSAPRTLFSLDDQPEGIEAVNLALPDRQGQFHVFFLRIWKPDDGSNGH